MLCSGVATLFSTSSFVQQAVFQTASSELVFALRDLDESYGGSDPGPGVPLGLDNSTTVVAITSRVINGKKTVQSVTEEEVQALTDDAGRFVFKTVSSLTL